MFAVESFTSPSSSTISLTPKLLALAVALAASHSAWSQDIPRTVSNRVLDEVVVTAQLREQRLDEVPIAASVVGGETLRAGNLNTLEELTTRVPNVRIAQVPGSDSINIRGVGSGNNLGFEQSVATFVDGVYRSRSRASRLAFFDVERVEVLRGPQTTFFGNNAIAGALNITTKRPGNDFGFDVTTLYVPEDGEYSVSGGVNVPVSDAFTLRVSARVAGMDGYIDNVGPGDVGPEQDSKVGRISFSWDAADSLTFDGRIDKGKVRDENIYNSELIFCPTGPEFGAPDGACGRYLALSGGQVDDKLNHKTATAGGYLDFDYTESVLRTTVDLERHQIVGVTGYYAHEYTQLVNVIPALGASVVGTAAGLPTRSDEDFTQISQEIRLQSDFGAGFEYMLGAYYAESELKAPSATGYYFAPFGAFVPGELSASDSIAGFMTNDENAKSYSIFASTDIDLTHRLRLGLGLRYSIVEKDASRTAEIGVSDDFLDSYLPVSGGATDTLLPVIGGDLGEYSITDRKDKKLLPSVTVEYDFADDTLLYASYRKGFKAGGFSFGLSKSIFDPETVDAYELGIKSTFLDRRTGLNVALFHSQYDGLQESTYQILANGTPKASIANVAKSTSEGLELSGYYKFTDALAARFDVAYLSAKYDEYELAPCTALGSLTANCTQDLSGKTRAFAPRYSGNVGLGYSTPILEKLVLRVDTDVSFTSNYYQQPNIDPPSKQEGFAKVDARIGVGAENGAWEVAIVGKNLNDKTTAGFRSPLPSSPGSYQAITDRPRSVGIQASINF